MAVASIDGTKKVVDLLLGVGVAGGAVYPVIARQGVKLPYVVVRVDSTDTTYTKWGGVAHRAQNVDVYVYASSYAECHSISESVVGAIDSVSYLNVANYDEEFIDPDTFTSKINVRYGT